MKNIENNNKLQKSQNWAYLRYQCSVIDFRMIYYKWNSFDFIRQSSLAAL